jgi:hypothetical protein
VSGVNDARLWHPWLRINRVLGAMLHERWSAEAWPQVKAEFKRALAVRSQIRGRVVLLRPFAFRKLVLLSSSIVLTGLPPEWMMTEL